MMKTTFFKSRDPGEGAGVGRGLNPHVVSRCAEPPTHKGRIYYPNITSRPCVNTSFPLSSLKSHMLSRQPDGSVLIRRCQTACVKCVKKKKSECGCEEKQDILSDRACGTRRTASDMRLNYSSVAEGGIAV